MGLLSDPSHINTHASLGSSEPAVLSIAQLTVAYGGIRALDRVNLKLWPGQLAALIGPNGAGKSTLFQALTGRVPVQHGRLDVAGQSVLGLPSHALAARGVARMTQHPVVFDQLTVGEQIRLATHPLRADRIPLHPPDEWVQALGNWLALAPVWGLRGAELGAPMQRRVQLAMCLAAQPRLLLLDEPAAGQSDADWPLMVQAIEWTRRECQTATLIIEHRLHWVWPLCNHCWVLNQGQVIAEGSPDAVQRHPAVIEAYLGEAPHGGA